MADSISSIVILKSTGLADSESEKKVCWGIEEEGIPYEVRTDPAESAVKLAYKAALISKLDIGIGIGTDHIIAVHYSRMAEDSPLFTSGSYSDSRDHMTLGMNAARLAKGLPFKEL